MRGKLIGALLSTLLLSGCQIGVSTDVRVSSATEAVMTASVTFEGEAAQALNSDRSLLRQVEDIMIARTGSEVKRTGSGDHLQFSADLPYDKLAASSGLLGVSSAILSADGDNATLSFSLVDPVELKGAIQAANSDQPDAAALNMTIFKTTLVGVKVTFPGSVTASTGSDNLEMTARGNTFTAYTTLEKAQKGSVSVTGSLKEAFLVKYRVILIGLGGAAIASGVWLLLKRRRLTAQA